MLKSRSSRVLLKQQLSQTTK